MDARLFRSLLLLLSTVLSFLACPGAGAQPVSVLPSSAVDSVNLYVLPTDGIPETVAADIARALSRDSGLRVKSSLWVPSGGIEPMAGSQQYAGEDYLALGVKLARQLRDAGPRTYLIVLTDRDINARSRNFRFQYAMHQPMARTSVLSIARLALGAEGRAAEPEILSQRIQKMLLRIVGEMKFGWQRNNDPADLMYAPIMSIEDIDRMSLVHTLQQRPLPGE